MIKEGGWLFLHSVLSPESGCTNHSEDGAFFSLYCAIDGRTSWVKVDRWSQQKVVFSWQESIKIKANVFGVVDQEKNST